MLENFIHFAATIILQGQGCSLNYCEHFLCLCNILYGFSSGVMV